MSTGKRTAAENKTENTASKRTKRVAVPLPEQPGLSGSTNYPYLGQPMSPDEYKDMVEQDRAESVATIRAMLTDLMPTLQAHMAEMKKVYKAPTLQECVLSVHPSCVRKFSNDTDGNEIADRAINLGTALYNKLQKL